jgi:hypothetical protein
VNSPLIKSGLFLALEDEGPEKGRADSIQRKRHWQVPSDPRIYLFRDERLMSAFGGKADIAQTHSNVCF